MRCFALVKANLVSYSEVLALEWEAFLRLESFNIFQKNVEEIYLKNENNSNAHPVEKEQGSKGVSISSTGVVSRD